MGFGRRCALFLGDLPSALLCGCPHRSTAARVSPSWGWRPWGRWVLSHNWKPAPSFSHQTGVGFLSGCRRPLSGLVWDTVPWKGLVRPGVGRPWERSGLEAGWLRSSAHLSLGEKRWPLSARGWKQRSWDGTLWVREPEGLVAAWPGARAGGRSWRSAAVRPVFGPHSLAGPFYHLQIPPWKGAGPEGFTHRYADHLCGAALAWHP